MENVINVCTRISFELYVNEMKFVLGTYGMTLPCNGCGGESEMSNMGIC